MKDNKKSIIKKTSKGYRLKDSTHEMIEKVRLATNGSMDTVISRAVKLYFIRINKRKKTKALLKNKVQKDTRIIL